MALVRVDDLGNESLRIYKMNGVFIKTTRISVVQMAAAMHCAEQGMVLAAEGALGDESVGVTRQTRPCSNWCNWSKIVRKVSCGRKT